MKEKTPVSIAYVTKWALTQGILLIKNGEKFDDKYLTKGSLFISDTDWFTTEEAAKQRVREMVVAKKKSIEKQIARLDKIADGSVKIVPWGDAK